MKKLKWAQVMSFMIVMRMVRTVDIQHCYDLTACMSTNHPITIFESFVGGNNDVVQIEYCTSFGIDYHKNY